MRRICEKTQGKYLGRGQVMWNKKRFHLRGRDRQKVLGTKIGGIVPLTLILNINIDKGGHKRWRKHKR